MQSGWPELTSDDPVIDAALSDLFASADAPMTRIGIEVDDRDSVVGGHRVVGWSIDGEPQAPLPLSDVLLRCVGLLNRHALDADPGRFHLHAALAGDAARTVLIPGARGAGKTTLVAALIDRGWSYGTDEMVAVEPDGACVALRKPLNCKPGSLERFDHVRRLLHPSLSRLPTDRGQLGLPRDWMDSGAVPVTDIVVAVRSTSHTPPTLAPLPPAGAVRILVENSFDFERHGPGRSLKLAAHLVGGARTWTLTYDDAVAAAGLLATELTVSEDGEGMGLTAPADVVTFAALDASVGGDEVRQAPGTLGVSIGGDGVIWVPALGQVMQVSAAGFAAWASADGTSRSADRAGLLGTSPADLGRVDADLVQVGVLRAAASPERA